MKKVIALGGFLSATVAPLLANNADNFKEQDPIGWMMAIIAMSVVFTGLVVLFLCFKYLYPLCAWCGLKIKKSLHRKKQLEQITDRRAAQQMKVTDKATGKEVDDEELAAAIGVALFLHEDGMHDQESGVITLASTSSPWTGAGQNHKHSPLRKF